MRPCAARQVQQAGVKPHPYHRAAERELEEAIEHDEEELPGRGLTRTVRGLALRSSIQALAQFHIVLIVRTVIWVPCLGPL